MKSLLIFSAFSLVCAVSAQSYSGAYAFDTRGKGTAVVAYQLRSFTDVFDRKGFNLDLDALSTVEANAKVGFALTWAKGFKIPFSNELRPKVDLRIGPWVNYGTGNRKLSGGLFFGFGGSF